MAYRRSRGKGRKKIEPAELVMNYIVPGVAPGTTNEFYIDLSQSASLSNRRFYRQGINWAVQSMKLLSPITSGIIVAQKVPTTWVMSNAWEKAFRSWQEMNQEALEQNESIRPRFLDFKIFADAQHHFDGYAQNLLPYAWSQLPGAAVTLQQANPGEWESSKISVPTSGATGNATDFEMIAVGPSYPGAGASTLNAVSLIEGYAASRGLPNVLDPNAPSDADDVGPTGTPENWIGALKNEGTDQDGDVLDRMVGLNAENNIAPYPFENDGVNVDTMYPGGANQLTGLMVHDTEYITGTTVGGRTMIDGGMFPCGLLKLVIQNTSDVSGDMNLQINLVPGHHRGYLCEPMTEM